MSIKPIDIKTMIPKTQQISKIQQAENDKQNNLAQIQNSNQTKTAKKELKTVNDAEKTFKTKITKDDNQDNNKGGYNKNKNSDSNRNKSDCKVESDGIVGVNIDIKI